jgi:cell fate regulator YaaT (PSP1 superfamily)
MLDLGPDPFEERPHVNAVWLSRVVDLSGNPIDELEDEAPTQAPPSEKDVDPHSMIMATGVQFKTAGKIYEFDARGVEYGKRSVVIAETEHGVAMGEVIRQSRMVPRAALPPRLFPISRVASRHDYRQREKNREMEEDIFHYTQARLNERELGLMRLVDVSVFQTGKKALVYFTSDERIDFRDLVRDLVQRYRLRLELRQIGPRDAAKLRGGIGDCGRELCCSSFLRDFAPVSIRMAKDQGLALNPNKIAGQCGKLKCCLAYEDDVYKELGKELPRVGKKVSCSSGGCGTVAARNVLREEITVVLDDGARLTLKRGEWSLMDRGPRPDGRPETREESPLDRHESILEDDQPDEEGGEGPSGKS